MAGGYPFFAQMAGYYLVEGKMQNLADAALIDFVTENFNQQSSSHYAHLWTTCSDGEKSMCISVLALSLQKGEKKIPTSLENLSRVRSRATMEVPALVRRGLLEEQGKAYSLFSSTFGRWIRQELSVASGDDESPASAEKIIHEQPENLKALSGVLPSFKKKYWPALADIAKGFMIEVDPVSLIGSLA